jgi:hypothetical protein
LPSTLHEAAAGPLASLLAACRDAISLSAPALLGDAGARRAARRHFELPRAVLETARARGARMRAAVARHRREEAAAEAAAAAEEEEEEEETAGEEEGGPSPGASASASVSASEEEGDVA